MSSPGFCAGLFCLATLLISSSSWAESGSDDLSEPDKVELPEADTLEDPVERHFILPWAEIFLQQTVTNLGGRVIGADYAQISPRTAWINLQSAWVVDEDAFLTNQLGHPYQGALYFTAARSSHLGFWWSSLYTTLGSVAWEYFGENVPPSINDQFTTTIGGIMVGEMMHRMSQAALSRGSGWGQLVSSTMFNPMGAFNTHVFDIEQPLTNFPAAFGDVHLGYSFFRESRSQKGPVVNQDTDTYPNLVTLGLDILYGVPVYQSEGRWLKPLESFHGYMDVSTSIEETFGSVFVSGAFAGYRYQVGPVRALTGLYSTFDYFSIRKLRFSSVGVGVGGSAYMPFGDKNFVYLSAISSFVPFGASGRGEEQYNFDQGAAMTMNLRIGREDLGSLSLSSRSVGLGIGKEEHGEVSRNALSLRAAIWKRHGVGVDLIGLISVVEKTGGKRLNERTGGRQARLLYTYFWDTSFGYKADKDR